MKEIEQSLLMRAYRGQRGRRVPCWFMRQAGRYLPEYRELRKTHPMLELIRTPKLAAEVTFQPLRRFNFDGSIIFADILNPLIGMGVKLDFIEGEGPKIFNLIHHQDDVAALSVPDPESNIPYTLEAITIVSSEINKKGLPLLGFCGAPFTLSSYLLSGRPSEDSQTIFSFINTQPSAWHDLQKKLTELVTTHLVAQVKAGASAVQLFDTWVGVLDEPQYNSLVKPYLVEIVKNIKRETAAPIVYFGKGATHLLGGISTLGFDTLSIDWTVPLNEAARLSGSKTPLQGNLDPELLLGDDSELLTAKVQEVLQAGTAAPSHIFNLGHGILPGTPFRNVEVVLSTVSSFAQELA